MNDRQLEIIQQIIVEQLGDYLAPQLAEELRAGIMMGIVDNSMLLEEAGKEERP